MKKSLLAGFVLATLTSCMAETLTVHMDYISHENLASAYIGSPDPLLEAAIAGQRLIVSWWIPLAYKSCNHFELRIKLRYGNREEAETTVPFENRQGWYVYALTNDEYFEKNGIKTYDVQLFADGELISEWKHQLWVNLIEFPAEDTDD